MLISTVISRSQNLNSQWNSMRSDRNIHDWSRKLLERNEEDGYLGRSVWIWEQGMSDAQEGTGANMDKKLTGFKKSTRTNKPMIEKKRRDRINACLMELKSMVVDSRDKELVVKPSKLEKADILELTVKYIQDLILHCKPAMSESTMPSFYTIGYQTCIAEVSRFFETISDLNNHDKCQILSRLKERARVKRGTGSQVGSATVADVCPVQNHTLADDNRQQSNRPGSASFVAGVYPVRDHTLVEGNQQQPTRSASASSVADVCHVQDHTFADANRQQPTRTAQQEPEHQSEPLRRPEFVQGTIIENNNMCALESAPNIISNSVLLNSDQSDTTKTQSTNFQNRAPHQILYVPVPQGIHHLWCEDNGKFGSMQPVLVPPENDLIPLNVHGTQGNDGLSVPYVIMGQLSVGRQKQICADKKLTYMKNISTAGNCNGCVGKSFGAIANMDKNFVWRPW